MKFSVYDDLPPKYEDVVISVPTSSTAITPATTITNSVATNSTTRQGAY